MKKKQLFSLRKKKIGLCSVILGMAIIGGAPLVAHADSVDTTQATTQPNVAQTSDTQNTVAAAEKTVNDLTQEVATAEAKRDASDHALDEATTALDVAEAVSNAADIEAGHADSAVDNAKEALTQATASADATNDARANAQRDVDTQEKAVAAAKDTVAVKTQEVADARDAHITANQTLNAKEAESETKLTELDNELKKSFNKTITKTETVSINPTAIENKADHNGMATLISSGTPRTETIVIPESRVQDNKVIYTPNKEAIAKYLVEYINELRAQNGISTKTEVTTDAAAIAFAQARAQENANRQRIGHDTELTAPRPYFEQVAMSYIYNIEKPNGMRVYSDKEYAYRLVTGWASEYGNLFGGHGHFAGLLYGKGPIAFGTAQQETEEDFLKAYGKDVKQRQDILHFVSPGKYQAAESDYNKIKEVETNDGTALVLGNGKRAVGLPEVTFNYLVPTTVKDTDAIKKAQEAYDNYKDQWQAEKDSLNKAIAAAATTLTAKTTALEAAKEDLNTKEAALETAKAALKKAIDEASANANAVRDAKAAFDTAVARAKDAHQKADDARVALRNAYENRQQRIAELRVAQKAYSDANEKFVMAKYALEVARAVAKPVEPTKPVEPVKPVEPTKPVKPAKPIEPAKPVEPTKPIEPAKPADTAKPQVAVGQKTPKVEKSHVVSTKVEQVSTNQATTVETTQAVVNRRGTTDYQASLPQTGEADTAVYVLAGLGMIGLAGVGLVNKERRN